MDKRICTIKSKDFSFYFKILMKVNKLLYTTAFHKHKYLTDRKCLHVLQQIFNTKTSQ